MSITFLRFANGYNRRAYDRILLKFDERLKERRRRRTTRAGIDVYALFFCFWVRRLSYIQTIKSLHSLMRQVNRWTSSISKCILNRFPSIMTLQTYSLTTTTSGKRAFLAYRSSRSVKKCDLCAWQKKRKKRKKDLRDVARPQRQHCSKIMKPTKSLSLQMAERLRRAQPESVANHVTDRSISD